MIASSVLAEEMWRAASGLAVPIRDADVWSAVEEASSYTPADRYILFEFLVSEARCHGYGDVPMPATKRWIADA